MGGGDVWDPPPSPRRGEGVQDPPLCPLPFLPQEKTPRGGRGGRPAPPPPPLEYGHILVQAWARHPIDTTPGTSAQSEPPGGRRSVGSEHYVRNAEPEKKHRGGGVRIGRGAAISLEEQTAGVEVPLGQSLGGGGSMKMPIKRDQNDWSQMLRFFNRLFDCSSVLCFRLPSFLKSVLLAPIEPLTHLMHQTALPPPDISERASALPFAGPAPPSPLTANWGCLPGSPLQIKIPRQLNPPPY